jgi:hypothetical protein
VVSKAERMVDASIALFVRFGDSAGIGELPHHPSVLPDAPEGWERDQELKETLDAAQATLEEGGSAAGHLSRPVRWGFFSAGRG